MADEPENLILVYLRRLDSALQEMREDLREIKERLTAVEIGQAAIRRDIAALSETDARLQAGMDRMREDIGRIKRRLDLVDAP